MHFVFSGNTSSVSRKQHARAPSRSRSIINSLFSTVAASKRRSVVVKAQRHGRFPSMSMRLGINIRKNKISNKNFQKCKVYFISE